MLALGLMLWTCLIIAWTLTALKLMHVLPHWSWSAVLSPLWAPILAVCVALLGIMIVAFCCDALDRVVGKVRR